MQLIDQYRGGTPPCCPEAAACSSSEQPKNSLPRPICSFSTLSNFYENLKTSLLGDVELTKRLQPLVGSTTLSPEDLDTLVEAFKSPQFFKVRPLIAKIIEQQSAQQSNEVLKAIFKAHAFEEAQPLFKKLSSVYTLQKVEEAVRSEFQAFQGSLHTAQQLSPSAERTHQSKEFQQGLTLINTVKYYVLNTIDWFVESVLFILQLKDVTDNDATKMEKQMVAQMRYNALRDNIAIVGAWVIGLTLYTGSLLTTALITAAVTAVLIAGYALYVNFLQPCPHNVHPGVNKSAEASKGLITPVYGREEVVKKVFDILERNEKTRARRYPMIRGGTGVGKSDLGNAMAMYLASPECPKEWQGKKLFVVSTADIVTGGAHGKMEHLHHIKDVLEGRENEAILFFTEVHVGFQEKTFFLGQELKTLCDAPGGFPYMIFATTDKEYKEHIAKDTAFTRRLEFFDIASTSDKVTELIISDMVTREAPDILVEKEAIEEVSKIRSQLIEIEGKPMAVFQECPQPFTSVVIASKALANARHPWFKELEQTLQDKKTKRALLDQQLKLVRGASYLPYSEEGSAMQKKLQKVDKKIAEIEKKIEKSRNELQLFRSLVKKSSLLQEEIEDKALQIQKAAKKEGATEEILKEFLFLLNFRKRAMDECLNELSVQLKHAHPIIDRQVMQEFIKQEAAAYLRKTQEKQESILIKA
jgi:hypothetical protein